MHRSPSLPAGIVYAESLIIFPFDSYSAFCVLQSRCHEIWARAFSSSMKDDLRYTPSDCFETFAFPMEWVNSKKLEIAGREYYEFRAGLMQRNGEGLTKTYNRFHDRYEYDPDIVLLRDLHANMDRAVLSEYGWDSIPTDCGFLPDHESEQEPSAKRFWRYRWPNDVRDQVLGHLIELNALRKRSEEKDAKVKVTEIRPRRSRP